MLEKQSVTDQVAAHLREELGRQRWTGIMPGRDKLARELGVHGSTVERALQLLENEGLLERAGPGKPRSIVSQGISTDRPTRICVLLYEAADRSDDYILKLQYELGVAGHHLSFAPHSMRALKFDPDRIEAMVSRQSADAWIVYSGSQAILQRFLELSRPTFALFGRMSGMKIAGSGTDILAALREAVGWLHGQGHRRMVMLTRSQLVESGPGLTERTFIEELEKHEVVHSSYNLAVWDNTADGLRRCLDMLFQVTPPTAIFVDDWMIHHAVQHYLFHKSGVNRHQVSCICMDSHPSFAWCQPEVPHFYWDPEAVVNRAVTWVRDVSRGKRPLRQKMIEAEFRGRESCGAV